MTRKKPSKKKAEKKKAKPEPEVSDEFKATYNVVIGGGYAEDYHPAKLWLNYYTDDVGLAASQLARRFFEALMEYAKQDIPEPSRCCKKWREKEKSFNYCPDCGSPRIEGDEEDLLEDARSIFFALLTSNLDTIASNRHNYSRIEEFLYEFGWELCGEVTTGPVALVTAFDRYFEDPDSSHPCNEFFLGDIVVNNYRQEED